MTRTFRASPERTWARAFASAKTKPEQAAATSIAAAFEAPIASFTSEAVEGIR